LERSQYQLTDRKQWDSLCHKQKHDGIKRRTRRILKKEASRNEKRIYTREGFVHINLKNAQANEKQDDAGKEQQNVIQCLQSLPDITHRT
jgi:hypothetical protein